MQNMTVRIIVSSCLVGKKCAYDGLARENKAVKDLCSRFGYIDVCPEIEGGLQCPREIHEIESGDGLDVLNAKSRVKSCSGKDSTEGFILGAKSTLAKAQKNHIKVAVLKARSPSCGNGLVYSGKFDGKTRKGNGVTTALLLRHGIFVFTEDNLKEADNLLKSG
ncbi:MAG: DUF523 domain-containing protein [Candidatus Omnitrophota bacterium]